MKESEWFLASATLDSDSEIDAVQTHAVNRLLILPRSGSQLPQSSSSLPHKNKPRYIILTGYSNITKMPVSQPSKMLLEKREKAMSLEPIRFRANG